MHRKNSIIPKICHQKQIKIFKSIYKFGLKYKFDVLKIKKDINKFFNFYKFVLIYFFVGNFFIQNKFKKTTGNFINTSLNYYNLSKLSENIHSGIHNFLNFIKFRNIVNINKSIILINLKYYLLKLLIKTQYNNLNILLLYLKKIKLIFNFVNTKIFKIFKYLNDICKRFYFLIGYYNYN